MTEYSDVPPEVLVGLRAVCLGLPETSEEQAWAGRRWTVRRRTFAHVLSVDSPSGPTVVLTFRSSGDELDALRSMGHPFFRPGWGTNTVGMVLSAAEGLDWTEIQELLTESYCILAPKKLASQVPRPAV
ncbi:MAG TPA: MmcQ/YjbR family DNA-binding protein [Acidimicrobiales bacterium]|nr:MmcQ/YjbR family DNA-binding protein [Acidimicrobiales bacterium]